MAYTLSRTTVDLGTLAPFEMTKRTIVINKEPSDPVRTITHAWRTQASGLSLRLIPDKNNLFPVNAEVVVNAARAMPGRYQDTLILRVGSSQLRAEVTYVVTDDDVETDPDVRVVLPSAQAPARRRDHEELPPRPPVRRARPVEVNPPRPAPPARAQNTTANTLAPLIMAMVLGVVVVVALVLAVTFDKPKLNQSGTTITVTATPEPTATPYVQPVTIDCGTGVVSYLPNGYRGQTFSYSGSISLFDNPSGNLVAYLTNGTQLVLMDLYQCTATELWRKVRLDGGYEGWIVETTTAEIFISPAG